MGKRERARSEIVDGDVDADAMQLTQIGQAVEIVVEKRAFRELDLQPLRRQTAYKKGGK